MHLSHYDSFISDKDFGQNISEEVLLTVQNCNDEEETKSEVVDATDL